MGKSTAQLDREIADIASSIEVPLGKLYAWRPKLDETLVDVWEGRLSHATGRPIRVSRLSTPRGAYMVMDGHHRAVEALQAGERTIRIVIDKHLPNIERAGGGFDAYVNNKVRIADIVRRRNP